MTHEQIKDLVKGKGSSDRGLGDSRKGSAQENSDSGVIAIEKTDTKRYGTYPNQDYPNRDPNRD